MLWSTHLLDEIAADDHVFMLEKGQLVKSASGRELDLHVAGAP